MNKIRPIINNDGWLVAINNALFLSGKDYMTSLEALCADGYVTVEEIIPVPQDFTGTHQTQKSTQPVDPAPFNHSTKIAVLRIKRK
jgi:23S rRNA (cytosine1962-C5)-methyltransferase